MAAARKKATSKTANSRTNRSATNREKETRRKPWTPPALLETPPPPAGYCYRWLRESMMNEMDKGNMSKRLREGWELVRPEELADSGYEMPVTDEGKHAGVVGIGGLVLAKIPQEIVDERNAYFEAMTNNQLEAIDAELAKASNPIMPIRAPNRKTRVEFGNPDNKPSSEED